MWHVLSEPDEEWLGLRGRISKSILATTILGGDCPDDGSNFACVCGPSDFILETLRYKQRYNILLKLVNEILE